MSAGRARGLSQAHVLLLLLALGLPARRLAAQSCPDARTWRLATLTGGAAALEGLAIAAFHDEWWDTPRRDFHVLWGRSPAKGQDGLFHGLLGYHTAGLGAAALRWACLSGAAGAWLGAAGALLAQLPKEVGDGFHNGFSVPDLAWVVAGGALQASRQTWEPARAVRPKWTYWPSPEHDSDAPGSPGVFTDWAGQRFYLAVHPAAGGANLAPWPRWLGVAVGHGVPYWVTQPPERIWYLVFDVEFSELPVPGDWWRGAAAFLDQFHLPAPGLRLRAGQLNIGLF